MKLQKKHLFRKYERVLFHSEDVSKSERVYGFYLLLRPLLGWVKSSLLDLGLLAAEVESELFLLCERLFTNYNKEKSSLIPYLEQQLPWQVSKIIAKTNKSLCLKEEPRGLLNINGDYNLDEEFYWRVPSFLFEDRYVGKCFTRSEKYVITKTLTADNKELSVQGLARLCNIDSRTMKNILSGMQEVFITGGIK